MIGPEEGGASPGEQPELYALRREAGQYRLTRRDLLQAAATAGALVAGSGVGCAAGASPTPTGRMLIDGENPPPLRAHAGSIVALAFSPDGALLASAGADRQVKLWAPADGTARGRALVNSTHPALAFATNGRLAAAPAAGGVLLWHHPASAPTVPSALLATALSAKRLAFSPDGALLAAALAGQGVAIWPIPGARPDDEPLLLATQSEAGMVAFSPDGRILVAGFDPGLTMWAAPGEAAAKPTALLSDGTPRSFAFAPDGGSLAVALGFGGLAVWPDVAQAAPAEPVTFYKASSVSQVAYSPDGNLLVASLVAGGLATWVDPGRRPKGRPTVLYRDYAVDDFVISPDGRHIALSMVDGRLGLCVEPQKEPGPEPLLLPTQAPVTALNFSPDGQTLATGDRSGNLTLWELDAPRRRWVLVDTGLLTTQLVLRTIRRTKETYEGVVCSCDMVWQAAVGKAPRGQLCVCDTIAVGSLKPGGEGGSKTARTMDGTQCVCDEICTCNRVCTCNTISRGGGGGRGGGHYWRANFNGRFGKGPRPCRGWRDRGRTAT